MTVVTFYIVGTIVCRGRRAGHCKQFMHVVEVAMLRPPVDISVAIVIVNVAVLFAFASLLKE